MTTGSNIINLSKHTDDGMMRSPEQLLEEALEYIKEGRFDGFKKMMVLTVDDKDGQYRVYWMQAGMKTSECLLMAEVAKYEFLRAMNYLT